MRFTSTERYIASDDLAVAVNAAITLERPLLVKGEPGTGKTELARQISNALGLSMIEWHVKSTTRAAQGLYEYDAVSRLRDSQLGDGKVADVGAYIKRGKLWDAFAAKKRVVLLIDEIRTICCKNSTGWSFTSTRPVKLLKPRSAPLSSSHPTTKKNCPTPFYAAAFFTTSGFPRWRR